jgi:hypothetical protein
MRTESPQTRERRANARALARGYSNEVLKETRKQLAQLMYSPKTDRARLGPTLLALEEVEAELLRRGID